MHFYFLTLFLTLISCEMIVQNVTENGQNLQVIAVEPQEDLQIVRFTTHTILKVKFLSKNSILTKTPFTSFSCKFF